MFMYFLSIAIIGICGIFLYEGPVYVKILAGLATALVAIPGANIGEIVKRNFRPAYEIGTLSERIGERLFWSIGIYFISALITVFSYGFVMEIIGGVISSIIMVVIFLGTSYVMYNYYKADKEQLDSVEE